MKKEFIEKMHAKLISQRNEILESLTKTNDQLISLSDSALKGDECDIANESIDRLMLDSLGQQEANRLTLINNAIIRINQNKYGVCIKCGKDIPIARLEAVPWAGMCIDCKSQVERKGN